MVLAPRSPDPISRLWQWSQRRRAIRRFLRVLPRRLLEDYGHQGPYTPLQIEATIRRHKVSSPRYADYAAALFCDADQLRQIQTNDVRSPDYGALREELAGPYFGGDPDFTWKDANRITSEHGGGDFSAHHSGEGADTGHHGGDGGGHH
jgi:hypothetical protein